MGCTCEVAGFCTRHGMQKTEAWHNLCRYREDYRRAWDEGRGPGQERSEEYRRNKILEFEKQLEYTRALWAEIHAKQDPDPVWLMNWCLRVPNYGCGCFSWLIDYLINNPPDYNDWYNWTVRLHNAVNAKLNKPQWTPPKDSTVESF